jgi:hypothetical protein
MRKAKRKSLVEAMRASALSVTPRRDPAQLECDAGLIHASRDTVLLQLFPSHVAADSLLLYINTNTT